MFVTFHGAIDDISVSFGLSYSTAVTLSKPQVGTVQVYLNDDVADDGFEPVKSNRSQNGVRLHVPRSASRTSRGEDGLK